MSREHTRHRRRHCSGRVRRWLSPPPEPDVLEGLQLRRHGRRTHQAGRQARESAVLGFCELPNAVPQHLAHCRQVVGTHRGEDRPEGRRRGSTVNARPRAGGSGGASSWAGRHADRRGRPSPGRLHRCDGGRVQVIRTSVCSMTWPRTRWDWCLIQPQSQKVLAVTGGRGYGIEPVSIVRGRVTRPCAPRQSFDEDIDNLS